MRLHRKPSIALAYSYLAPGSCCRTRTAVTETARSRIRATFDCLLGPKQTRVSCGVYTRDLCVLGPLRVRPSGNLVSALWISGIWGFYGLEL